MEDFRSQVRKQLWLWLFLFFFFRWLSVWCRQFEVNFGDVTFPDPQSEPTLVGSLSELQYDVSGKVYIVDDKKILIENFNYNGKVVLRIGYC